VPLSAAVCPLVRVLEQVPEFRGRHGRRHPLPAILALAVAATLCGYKSYGAMAEWGRSYGAPLTRALGFTQQTTPCAATLHAVFRGLDVGLLETLVGAWAEQVLAALPAPAGTLEGMALDGKTLRGRRKQGAVATHLLAALSLRLGLTLGEQAVSEQTNEIPIAQTLLAQLVLAGRVFTMDALLTQTAATIVAGGGST
jgi:hypothetical protein